MVQRVKVPFFGALRYDVLLHAFGVDAMEPAVGALHAPCFLMCGGSACTSDWLNVDIPAPEAGSRVEVLSLVVVCSPDLASEESCKATLIVTVDESKLYIPAFVLDFLTATVISRVFTRQAARARELGTAPPHDLHLKAIAADPQFYAQWLPRRLAELRATPHTSPSLPAEVEKVLSSAPQPQRGFCAFLSACLRCQSQPHRPLQ